VDLLTRIKRLVWDGRIRFTKKASFEMERDGIDEEDVETAIISARRVRTKRSTSRERRAEGEMVHILEGITLDGVAVYTKGVIRKFGGEEIFFVLISAKRSRRNGRD